MSSKKHFRDNRITRNRQKENNGEQNFHIKRLRYIFLNQLIAKNVCISFKNVYVSTTANSSLISLCSLHLSVFRYNEWIWGYPADWRRCVWESLTRQRQKGRWRQALCCEADQSQEGTVTAAQCLKGAWLVKQVVQVNINFNHHNPELFLHRVNIFILSHHCHKHILF